MNNSMNKENIFVMVCIMPIVIAGNIYVFAIMIDEIINIYNRRIKPHRKKKKKSKLESEEWMNYTE